MVIWIDVGTHKAQEYKSVLGSNRWFIIRLIRHAFSSLVLRRGSFAGFTNYFSLIKARNSLRSFRSQFRVAFIEANCQLLKDGSYSNVDDVFCLALSGGFNSSFGLTKLYHANDDQESQGNSIYKTKSNISLNQFTLCPKVSADTFASHYKVFLDSMYEDYQIVLRINCEGSEDDVIYAFSNHFGNKFKLILGSLKDVEGVKGEFAHQKMLEHIKSNGLLSLDWSSRVDTWLDAQNMLLKTVKA